MITLVSVRKLWDEEGNSPRTKARVVRIGVITLRDEKERTASYHHQCGENGNANRTEEEYAFSLETKPRRKSQN